MTPRENFQGLLKKLFQFDNAELDFGIYRIMNHKRAVIERFIETDLSKGLDEELFGDEPNRGHIENCVPMNG